MGCRRPIAIRTISGRLTANDNRYQNFACDAIGTYLPLQTARASADRVQRYLEQWTDAQVTPFSRNSGIAAMALFGGYSRIYLGEGFCSMAISSVFGTEITYGGEITRDSVFGQAEAKFTRGDRRGDRAGRQQSPACGAPRTGARPTEPRELRRREGQCRADSGWLRLQRHGVGDELAS